MKIAYVVRHFDSAGGRERVLVNKANYLARHFGYEVTIITTLQQLERTFYPLDERVAVRHLKLKDRESFGGGRKRYARYFKEAVEVALREIAPDIAVSMWWGAEFRALPKMRDGSRKLLELHSSYGVREYENRAGRMQWIRRIRWTLTKWAESRVVGQYDRLVVLTHEDAAHWRHRNLTVIPNSLSFVVDAASDQSRPVVVSVGRLTASKGFDRLLRAWAVIAEEYPTWQLRIFGSGEERENILHQIERFQLTNVMLSPPTPDIQEELLQASVFAFASRCEGFGMVLIEAMQCGLPAVAYRVPCGPSEIIGDGVSGYLVDDDDEAGFVAALRRLIANPELRRKMGLAAKRLSEDKFREDLIMARWQAVFEEMSVTCTD